MTRLDRDDPKIERIMKEFHKAASSHFGTLFPAFEIRSEERD
jgi:hypothetical protein